jgi:hypothetical protein
MVGFAHLPYLFKTLLIIIPKVFGQMKSYGEVSFHSRLLI